MKTNYTFKGVRNALAITAFVLGSSFASAQTATEYFENLRSDATITEYPNGAIELTSDQLTIEGVTFNVQATITPGGNGTFVGTTGGNRRWGIGSAVAENNSATIDGNYEELAVIDNISIVNFAANGTGYTESAFSNLHFDGITLRGVNGAFDDARIIVDGTNPGTTDIGTTTNTTETITFGVEFQNITTPVTIGDTDAVTSITLANATTDFRNSYQVIGTNVSYTFTTNPLSVDEFALDNALAVYPTVVENTFSVSKEFQTLHIIDLTGKTVKIFNASDALNVSGMNSGLYIVKIQSETGGIATSKLIVK